MKLPLALLLAIAIAASSPATVTAQDDESACTICPNGLTVPPDFAIPTGDPSGSSITCQEILDSANLLASIDAEPELCDGLKEGEAFCCPPAEDVEEETDDAPVVTTTEAPVRPPRPEITTAAATEAPVETTEAPVETTAAATEAAVSTTATAEEPANTPVPAPTDGAAATPFPTLPLDPAITFKPSGPLSDDGTPAPTVASTIGSTVALPATDATVASTTDAATVASTDAAATDAPDATTAVPLVPTEADVPTGSTTAAPTIPVSLLTPPTSMEPTMDSIPSPTPGTTTEVLAKSAKLFKESTTSPSTKAAKLDDEAASSSKGGKSSKGTKSSKIGKSGEECTKSAKVADVHAEGVSAKSSKRAKRGKTEEPVGVAELRARERGIDHVEMATSGVEECSRRGSWSVLMVASFVLAMLR